MESPFVTTAINVRWGTGVMPHFGWLIQRVNPITLSVIENIGFLVDNGRPGGTVYLKKFFPRAIVLYELEVTSSFYQRQLKSHIITPVAPPEPIRYLKQDQCQCMSDPFFGTKCTDLAKYHLSFPGDSKDSKEAMLACEKHFGTIFSGMVGSTAEGKVIVQYYHRSVSND